MSFDDCDGGLTGSTALGRSLLRRAGPRHPASYLALAALLAPIALVPAHAQTKAKSAAPAPQPAAVPSATPPQAAPSGDAGPAAIDEITGFRSARFGMTEAEIRDAIAKDFNLKPDAIRAVDNAAERTHALVVTVPDLLPGGGRGEVSYVFGYTSKRLIQVALAWSKGSDDAMTPQQLTANASALRTYFTNRRFKPDSVAADQPVQGGVLLFRGNDAKDHSTVLIMRGEWGGDQQRRTLTPTALTLYYLMDAKNPDIFKLPPGSF